MSSNGMVLDVVARRAGGCHAADGFARRSRDRPVRWARHGEEANGRTAIEGVVLRGAGRRFVGYGLLVVALPIGDIAVPVAERRYPRRSPNLPATNNLYPDQTCIHSMLAKIMIITGNRIQAKNTIPAATVALPIAQHSK